MISKITPKRLREIIMDCLFNDDEIEDGKPKEGVEMIEARGVHIHVGFHKGRIEGYRDEIMDLLRELNDKFTWNDLEEGGAGGASFLEMYLDRHGNHWGEHNHCDELIALGSAIDCVAITPSGLNPMMPSMMPYVFVDLVNPITQDMAMAISGAMIQQMVVEAAPEHSVESQKDKG